jgi:type II secretory pathway component GspD/PulD (secretin)
MSKKFLTMFFLLFTAAVSVTAEDFAPPPVLAETFEVPIRLSFSESTPATEVYRALGKAAGVEIIFDPRFNENQVAIEIDTSTTSEALDLVSAAAGDLWVPASRSTVIVADDTPQNHRQYEPLVVQSFVLENGSVREADKLLRSIAGVRNLSINEALRTVTVRETAGKMPIIEHLIASVDHAPGEIDARIELLQLTDKPTGESPPARFEPGEYAGWRRDTKVVVLADSTLSLLGDRHANLHLGSVQNTNLGLDLRLDGRVHPQSNDVSLEVRAILAPSGTGSNKETTLPSRGRIETSARLEEGTTLLLRVPGSGPGDIAIAITPTIVRSTDYDSAEMAAVWVGTESRMQASR